MYITGVAYENIGLRDYFITYWYQRNTLAQIRNIIDCFVKYNERYWLIEDVSHFR